jgi:hypothetical protein
LLITLRIFQGLVIKEDNVVKNSLLIFLFSIFTTLSYAYQDASENELSFIDYYSIHGELLDSEAPYAYSKESFVEHHNALVNVILEMEKNKSLESVDASEELTLIKSYWNLMNDVYAADANDICFFGGWPSKISRGKCQAPWKNANVDSLKELGEVYDSSHRCGRSDKFRCNPTLFGPGESGKGICITFSRLEEISEKCEVESRIEIDKIYERFQRDEGFRKKYLSLTDVMKSFCHTHSQYKACGILDAQVKKVAVKACGNEIDLNILTNTQTATRLSQDVGKITRPLSKKEFPTSDKKEEPRKSQKLNLDTEKLCSLYKGFVSKGVPREPLLQALAFFNSDQMRFENQRYISIGDYSQSSTNKRFYLLDLSNGEVSREKVSHGSGRNSKGQPEGDLDHDGMIDRCTNSNGDRKNMTRPGFYATGSLEYSDHLAGSGSPNFFPGKKANKLVLYGLSTSNSDAEAAGVVMHEAQYNEGGDKVMGRSYGCPAFVPGRGGPIVQKILGGSLFYSYVPTCAKEMKRALSDVRVKNWEGLCH